MKANKILTKKKIYRTKIPLFLVVISLIFIPFFIKSPYILHVIIMCEIYLILSSSYNLLAGYTGALSLCHHSFFGIGAYASALLMLRLSFSFPLAFILAGIIASIFSLAIAYPSLKLSYHSLATGTLAFSIILYILSLNLVWLTNGPAGIPGIPSPNFLGWRINNLTEFYYFTLVLDIVTLFVLYRVLHSRVGRALIAIREDEILASVVGININKYKIISFVVASFFAGIAGSIYASYISFIAPDLFWLYFLTILLIFFVIGGSAAYPTFYGIIISTILFVLIPEVLRIIPELREMIFGLTLIAILIFMPEGIGGKLRDLSKRFLHTTE
jgi:branched-chain amino acid transport system permease protein